jgi:hypothetical protein
MTTDNVLFCFQSFLVILSLALFEAQSDAFGSRPSLRSSYGHKTAVYDSHADPGVFWTTSRPEKSVYVKSPRPRLILSSYKPKRYIRPQRKRRLRMPSLRMPQFRMPSFRIPSIKMRSLRMPSFRMPSFRIPLFKIPSLRMRSLKMPSLRIPSFSIPALKRKMPSLRMRSLRMPSMKSRMRSLKSIMRSLKSRVRSLRMPSFRVQSFRMPMTKLRRKSPSYNFKKPSRIPPTYALSKAPPTYESSKVLPTFIPSQKITIEYGGWIPIKSHFKSLQHPSTDYALKQPTSPETEVVCEVALAVQESHNQEPDNKEQSTHQEPIYQQPQYLPPTYDHYQEPTLIEHPLPEEKDIYYIFYESQKTQPQPISEDLNNVEALYAVNSV